MMMPMCPAGFMVFPVIFLLSLSFFILVALSNVKTQALKVFGYVIVALIWLAAVLVFAGGACRMTKGMHPLRPSKKSMLKYPGMCITPGENPSEVMICPKAQKK
ncbi:MAG: hypothetical protein WC330_01330 [Candidatus Omnitrophota bacterium]|jgi:hypothetical protein